MRNCLLCNENPADKKGSHIVPHFLSKRIDNEEGETGRDKEMGFVITPKQTTSYFGRAVLPEKLEEVYGEITDELIENNNIDGFVDNYFCTNCESNLSVIESEYANTLNQKPEIDQVYESSTSGFVAFLFWTSIIWRLSIQDDSGFKLKLKEEKRLNRILKKYLKNNLTEIKPNPLDSDLNNIGYKLLRSPHYSDKNWTWLHWRPNYERPYSIMIDEYVLFLYFKKSHLKGMVMDFYGSENLKNKAEFNIPTENESIFSVPHKEYSLIVENIQNYGVKAVDKELDTNLDKIHQRLGKKGKMNAQLKAEIKKKIADSQVALGQKFTLKNQAEIIYESLSKYINT
ncbi:hypothetical protein [Aquimarina algiphila]|uniref:hypothetical protein n=1 Tax=Aquimarina algiphila TaxID=2047982 RepID=UPI00232E6AC2|nr:hypothetical protein [Aquimarina algiphila]